MKVLVIGGGVAGLSVNVALRHCILCVHGICEIRQWEVVGVYERIPRDDLGGRNARHSPDARRILSGIQERIPNFLCRTAVGD